MNQIGVLPRYLSRQVGGGTVLFVAASVFEDISADCLGEFSQIANYTSTDSIIT